MKKLFIFMLVMVLLLSLVACGNGNSGDSGNSDSVNGNNSSPNNNNAQKSNLNLPLEVKNQRFVQNSTFDSDCYYISKDGKLWSYSTNYGGRTEYLSIDDARSVYVAIELSVVSNIYVIKNDNSLWAKGSNHGGWVGDGTGVNKKEFVKIADDVADFTVPSCSLIGNYTSAYILKTDKTLWKFGREGSPKGFNSEYETTIYAPEKIADGVVRVLHGGYFLRTDGSVFMQTQSGWESGINNVVDAYNIDSNNWYTLSADGKFSKTTVTYEYNKVADVTEQEIDTDVACMSIWGQSIHFLKKDGSLWAFGENSEGFLGDGTKIDKDEPVKIADDVHSFSAYTFIKKDGTAWIWTKNEPSPKQIASASFDKIFANGYTDTYGNTTCGILQDGTLVSISQGEATPIKGSFDIGNYQREERQITVMLSGTLIFD